LLDLEAIAALHEAEIDIHSSGLMDCWKPYCGGRVYDDL
jgi:hypothetical protein